MFIFPSIALLFSAKAQTIPLEKMPPLPWLLKYAKRKTKKLLQKPKSCDILPKVDSRRGGIAQLVRVLA